MSVGSKPSAILRKFAGFIVYCLKMSRIDGPGGATVSKPREVRGLTLGNVWSSFAVAIFRG